MKLYTKTGDEGKTSVIGGRVDKDDVRVEAYGTVDELNSFTGQAISEMEAETALFHDLIEELILIQHELFDCGSDLAYLPKPEKETVISGAYKVTDDMVLRLEALIDRFDSYAPEIKRFILPGGSKAASLLHVCRTVCRRAERRVVTLAREQEMNPAVRHYLNRLSDFYFAAARAVNARVGVADVEYIRSAEVFHTNQKPSE